jgi:HD-like signal output (HDOD) protein
VARLLALYGEEKYSMGELVRILESDPAIASRLLRLANSAYYGFHRQVSTIQRAVIIVGQVTVQAVALAASLAEAWEGRTVPSQAEDLWVHAYQCGMGCRYLAQRLPASPWRSPGDALFLTGLLHDVGKLLFLAQSPEAYVADLTAAERREDLLARERDRFGQDHAEAGGDALDSWSFPPCMAAAVRYHHAGGLRAELRPDWEVLTTVDDLLRGLSAASSDSELPAQLLADLNDFLEHNREEAQSFYRAMA